ncbi:MAG: hypothetical protein HKM89_10805 [Gemmatimonadales bacterium]|nr:hypothetical protein [Gemmatimonadales bacterium]
MPRIMKWTVLPLAWVASACLAEGGVDHASRTNAGQTTQEFRDLTLATPRDNGASAVSLLELGRTEAREAPTASEADPDPIAPSAGAVVAETYAYLLEPAAAALPEVLRVRSAGGTLGAALAIAPVGASALPNGLTVGIPTPKPIEFTRPSQVNEYEPYEYASLAEAFAPSGGGGILGGIRGGGSCGPRGGL